MVESVVYLCTVNRSDNNTNQTYTGLTGGTFKKRFYGHTSTMKDESLKQTALSQHIWDLKHQNVPHSIEWEITTKAPSYNPTTDSCRLCLLEKYHITFSPHLATLNDRKEFFSHCRHKRKHLLVKPVSPVNQT